MLISLKLSIVNLILFVKFTQKISVQKQSKFYSLFFKLVIKA